MGLSTLRHIAREGRVCVVGVAPLLRGSDVPRELAGEVYGGEDDWMSRGRSAIVAPDGTVLAGPLIEQEGILTATLDPAAGRVARQQFDPVGHYSRPDVFQLRIDTRPRSTVATNRSTPRRSHECRGTAPPQL